MLLYDKKSLVSLCKEYISKTEQIIYKNDTAEYKYKKLILLKYEFESIKIYNKIPHDYEKFIYFFIDWNLKVYERFVDNNKFVIKDNLKKLFNVKAR